MRYLIIALIFFLESGFSNLYSEELPILIKPITSKVKVINGLPKVVIRDAEGNEKILPMLNYEAYMLNHEENYGAESWFNDLKKYIDYTAEAGFSYLGFNLWWYELDPSPTPPYDEKGNIDIGKRIDFKLLDGIFDYAGQKGVYLLPTLWGLVGEKLQELSKHWWYSLSDNFPKYCQTNSKGQSDYIPSFNNPGEWKYLDEYLRLIIHRYKDHPALLGWGLSYGMSNENNYPIAHYWHPGWFDYSGYAQEKFRAKMPFPAKINWASGPEETGPKGQNRSVRREQLSNVIEKANSPGDTRQSFYDWQEFRLEEKRLEREHLAQVFKETDPNHILIANFGSAPFITGLVSEGARFDYEAVVNCSYIDGVVLHPGVQAPHFDLVKFYNVINYTLNHQKICTWSVEHWNIADRLEKDDGINKIREISQLCLKLGSGVGWFLPQKFARYKNKTFSLDWTEKERKEIAKCSSLEKNFSNVPRKKNELALIDSPFMFSLDYEVPPIPQKERDVLEFSRALFEAGLDYDIITEKDIIKAPQILHNYKVVAVVDIFRMSDGLKNALINYRNQGGGLFLGGKTAIFDKEGKENLNLLKELLGIQGVPELYKVPFKIRRWRFNKESKLSEGITHIEMDERNQFYLPKFNYASSGYNIIATLTDAPEIVCVGYRQKVVFWFPRIGSITNQSALKKFLKNLYKYFGLNSSID